MAETDIGSTIASDLNNAMTDYSVDTQETDGIQDQKETSYTNSEWAQQLGYYKTIPELAAVIDAKATWTVGKGFQADEQTTMMLDAIDGFGADTFNTILENMIRTYHIGQDSFAEIIRDEDGVLINLKPLDTGTMSIITNAKGIIIRYEQNSKVKGTKPKKFTPDKIFHLCRNRVADEIHGQSMIQSLADSILRINEAKADWKKVLHRNVRPMMIWHMDTDDASEIAAFKATRDAAKEDVEDIYIPKGAVVPELIATAGNATLNPLPWIEAETQRFYETAGVPKIILGGAGGFTEAAVKIAYLAYQQTIEEEQLFIEEQFLIQVGYEIELEFPASLENELLSDKKKDGEGEEVAQPNDTIAEMEGNK